MKKKLLPATIFVLLLAGIFIQYEFNGDSLDKIEDEARTTQNIEENATLYYDVFETSESNEKVKLALLLFEEENKFTYSLYRNGEFVEGGAPMIDEYNAVSVLRSFIINDELFLIFYSGDTSVDKLAFVDCFGNVLDEIELTKGAYTKILKGNEVKNAEYYQLLKGNKVIKKVVM